jgi:hypothetical protein
MKPRVVRGAASVEVSVVPISVVEKKVPASPLDTESHAEEVLVAPRRLVEVPALQQMDAKGNYVEDAPKLQTAALEIPAPDDPV